MGLIESKFHYNRFIIGRPNIVVLPIQLVGLQGNYYHSNLTTPYYRTIEEVKLWTIEKYPPKAIFFDCSNIIAGKKYNLRDVAQLLPKGFYLHDDDKIRYDMIVIELQTNDNCDWLYNDERFMAEDVGDIQEKKDEVIDEVENDLKNKPVVKKAPRIPLINASGKVLALTKEKGSTNEAIKEYLESRKKLYRTTKKKKEESESEEDEDEE